MESSGMSQPETAHPTRLAPSLPAPSTETLRVKVDGRDLEVPRMMPDGQGRMQPTTMLQACQMAGVEVPHYCYHPRLPVAGNCRMCLIEFGTPMLGPDRKPVLNEDGTPRMTRSVLPYEPGTPRGAIACATPVSPGMELYPGSAATRQMREAVLESLLINHPLDCPICDQAGECKLQEYSVEHGQAATAFVETKVHKPKAVDLGPRILLDDERCILCTRCIRFTRDLVGDDRLGIVNRGSYNTIAAYPGTRFDNNYSLNTVDLCPVGALTSKDFRFRMRVWFLKETSSVCTTCATGCNTVVWSREGKVHRLTPRENDAVNASWMCDHGRLNIGWIGRPDRLREVRAPGPEGVTQRTTWTAAIRSLADRLVRAPKGSVAIVASARQTTEELYLLRRLADRWDAMIDMVPRLGEGDDLLVHPDKNPNTAGARLTVVAGDPPGSHLARIAAAVAAGTVRHLVVFGEDVTRCGMDERVLGQLETLAVSDLLPNPTTARAQWLFPGCAAVEKRGTFINAKGRVQRFLKAVEGPGEARPEVEMLLELEAALGGAPASTTLEGLFNRMAREIPALAGVEWAKLGEQGVTVAL